MEHKNGHPWLPHSLRSQIISSNVIEAHRLEQAQTLYRKMSDSRVVPDEILPTGISGHPDFVWWNRASVDTTPLQQFVAGLAVFVQYNLAHRIRTTLQRQGWSVMVIKPSDVGGAVRRIANRLDGLEIASMGTKNTEKAEMGKK